jgi:DNA polymerase-1
MLLKIISELKPDYIVACYDLPEPTYRHEVYEEYKAGRKEADDDLVAQIERSYDLFEAFQIPIYEKAGFEADDILGTIVEKTKSDKNVEVIIASGDMDTLQLVDKKKVQVYTLRKGIQDTVLYDEQAVLDRFQFKPELLTDYKGLRGDPSDNIIGIAGIGEKTATTLITSFGTIENMYKILDQKNGDEKFEKANIKPRIINLLRENKDEAEFSKMLATIRRDAPIKFSLPKGKWTETFDPNQVIDLFADLSFRTLSRRIETMFGVKAEKEPEEKKEEVSPKEVKKVGVALFVLQSDITNPSLEDILQFTKEKSFGNAKKKILDGLKKEKLEKVYKEIELPLMPITDKMHERGVKLDTSYLKKLSVEYHKNLSKLEKRIWKAAGREFNINSPRQLGEILFDEMELTPKNQKRTATGQKSTRESELEKMREMHPIIADILSYRELQKLLSTYIDNFTHMVDNESRIHAEFLQTGAATGRMASQNPNLQNIPIKTELGRRIRNAFVATKGFTLVALDYSQIELRIAAFLSGDKKLIKIFRKGEDVHNAVASEVFGVKEDEVDKEMRRKAKVINFGILYGMGVNALRQNLGTDRKEAQAFYNEYFEKFSGLADYLDDTKARAFKRGFTETLFGRKRYFESIKSTLPHIRAHSERMAINAPIQGTQADITKIAMSKVDDYISKNNLEKEVFLLLQIHDELIFEIKTSKVNKVAKDIRKIMESVVPLKDTEKIPLTVDVSTGPNWGELKKI